MKRILSLVLAMVLLLTLAACGGPEIQDKKEKPTPEPVW